MIDQTTENRPSHGAPPVRCVLFDLDGTFADTAPDLANALNHVLLASGLAALPFERIRPEVSHGAGALIRLGFGDGLPDDQSEDLRQQLLTHYRSNLCQETRLFPGVRELLEQLEQRAIPWGIVTNKPARFTDPLLRALGWFERAGCVISGDSTAEAKPHPLPILTALRQLERDPTETVYVGDAARDMEAGRRAGCRTIAASFGYLAADEDPRDWNADACINHPAELLEWLHER